MRPIFVTGFVNGEIHPVGGIDMMFCFDIVLQRSSSDNICSDIKLFFLMKVPTNGGKICNDGHSLFQ